MRPVPCEASSVLFSWCPSNRFRFRILQKDVVTSFHSTLTNPSRISIKVNVFNHCRFNTYRIHPHNSFPSHTSEIRGVPIGVVGRETSRHNEPGMFLTLRQMNGDSTEGTEAMRSCRIAPQARHKLAQRARPERRRRVSARCTTTNCPSAIGAARFISERLKISQPTNISSRVLHAPPFRATRHGTPTTPMTTRPTSLSSQSPRPSFPSPRGSTRSSPKSSFRPKHTASHPGR